MSQFKLKTRTDFQAARDLGRELRNSGASGVEVVDVVTDAFSDAGMRLVAYREAYSESFLDRVGQRLRQAKGA